MTLKVKTSSRAGWRRVALTVWMSRPIPIYGPIVGPTPPRPADASPRQPLVGITRPRVRAALAAEGWRMAGHGGGEGGRLLFLKKWLGKKSCSSGATTQHPSSLLRGQRSLAGQTILAGRRGDTRLSVSIR